MAGPQNVDGVHDCFRRYPAVGSSDLKGRNPPGEAIRGPSRSSTTVDPEPTAQTGAIEPFPECRANEARMPKPDRQADLVLPGRSRSLVKIGRMLEAVESGQIVIDPESAFFSATSLASRAC